MGEKILIANTCLDARFKAQSPTVKIGHLSAANETEYICK